MGGDHLPCSTSEDESSSLDYEYPDYPFQTSSFYRDGLRTEDEDESISGSYVFVPSKLDEVNHEFSSNSREFDGNLRRRKNAYNEIIRGYDELWVRSESFHQAKSRILSYNPGSWISNAGGKKLNDFVIPKTTTLLLIGPKGSGKSSLVNRILRVFEDDKFSSERAQVTYNPSAGEGTYFLQEYMIPRGSTSFCLFDSRSLSENFADNDEMLKSWMTKGVRHGELVIRDSDDPILKISLKCKAQRGNSSSVIRKVNFVIFVINGFEVLSSMNSDFKEDKSYMEMVVKTLSCPYLSFKDDKPVVVVTHGDLLSLGDRARVREYLGEKLGVPPTKQIFDIPDSCDPSSELMIVDMIRYSLEHADKNMPCKESRDWVDRSTFFVDSVKDKVSGMSILTLIFTAAILLGIACIIIPTNQVNIHSDPLVASAIKRPSYEAHLPHKPEEPLTAHQSNSESTSAANHRSPVYENAESDVITPLPKEPVAVTSEPTSVSDDLEIKLEQASPLKSVVVTSEPTSISETVTSKSDEALSSKSTAIKPEPTLPSKTVADYRHERRKPRSPSHERRHPKAAVKWHKIRHLWLDSD